MMSISYKTLLRLDIDASLRSAHRGFFGCKHFSKANALLTSSSPPQSPIEWSLERSIVK